MGIVAHVEVSMNRRQVNSLFPMPDNAAIVLPFLGKTAKSHRRSHESHPGRTSQQ